MAHDKTISIWFFVGVLLLVYGLMILGYGLLHMSQPTPGIVLGEMHIDVWWGALLSIVGALYTYLFAPGRGRG